MPYQKFNGNSYEFGDFLYSFSLYPTIAQPSGELNFNVLKESSLELELDSNVINENIYFSTFVKEYQILRIISGQPSLSWI